MSTLTLHPRLRAAFGYANIVAGLPIADLVAGYSDNWEAMSRAATRGPRERIHVVHLALNLCIIARKYWEEHEFERALSALLRAAGMAYDAPEGKEWRRRDEQSAWVLCPQRDRPTETPGIWSAKWVDRRIIVPAIVGVTFENEQYAISAAATVRRRCFEGHGSPEGVKFADRLDALTASVVSA